MKYSIFIINLDGSKERWLRIQSQLESQNLTYERIAAIDVREIKNQPLLSLYNEKKNKWHYRKNLSLGEIGCYLSHRKCWKKIVDDQLDFALILEDDVRLVQDLKEVITFIQKHSFSEWDYLKIGENPIKRKQIKLTEGAQFNFIRYKKIPIGAFAQIVKFEAAKKLLSNSTEIIRPVDVDIQYTWKNKLRIAGLTPYAIDAIKGQSDIADVDSKKNYTNRPWIVFKNSVEEWLYRLLS